MNHRLLNRGLFAVKSGPDTIWGNIGGNINNAFVNKISLNNIWDYENIKLKKIPQEKILQEKIINSKIIQKNI